LPRVQDFGRGHSKDDDMAKNFAPRIAKKDRKIIDLSDRLGDLF
jgi:hypothetical protein